MNKYVLKRIAAGALTGALTLTSLLSLAACDKNIEEKDKEAGYKVSSSHFTEEDGLYTYIINKNGFVSNKYDFGNTIRDISFAKVTSSKEYGTNLLNEHTKAFYVNNIKMILPDCYGLYNQVSWFSRQNFDYELKIDELVECAGPSYTVAYSSMTAKRDLSTNNHILKNGQKEFKKGDNMSSVSIYHDDELIYYKQYGVGSECTNVIEGTIEVPGIEPLSKVNLSDTKEVTYRELYEYQEKLNAETDNLSNSYKK